MSLFSELGLSAEIIRAIEEKGYTNPTPVQEASIPKLLTGDQDFLGLAQTGTGKTAAFGLPLLDVIDQNAKDTQALILAPTRELANQIAKDLMSFAKYNYTKVVPVFGGASIQTQISQLRRGAQVIVATPGRLLDLIKRRSVNITNIKYVVLDEADEMLNMGFKEDIREILSTTPDEKKTWLFSATMPKEIRAIANNFMTNPEEVTVGKANTTNENIEHHLYTVHYRDKYQALKRVVDFYPDVFGIVFCRTKSDTQKIADELGRDGYNADALHGDLSQAQRDRVMKNFKNKNLQLLVATDVAARGIDVDNVTHVLNYGLPDDIESYTHRSGRTARAGKKGISLAIVDRKDFSKVRSIERIINTSFIRQEVPSANNVCEKQLKVSLNKVIATDVNDEYVNPFLELIETSFEELSKEEIIKKIASVELNRFYNNSANTRNLNMKDYEMKKMSQDSKHRNFEENSRNRRSSSEDRIFINVGKADGMNRKDILEMVVAVSGVESRSIGDIDEKGAFSFIQVKKESSQDVLKAFRDHERDGKRVRTEMSKSDSGGRGGRDRRSGGNRGGGNRRFGDRDRNRGDRERGGDRGGFSSRRRDDKPREEKRSSRKEDSGFGDNKPSKSKGSGLSDLFSEPSNYF